MFPVLLKGFRSQSHFSEQQGPQELLEHPRVSLPEVEGREGWELLLVI